MTVKVLGIGGSGHEFASCFLEDGRLVRAVEEERLSRQKHGLGTRSLINMSKRYCLNPDHLDLQDMDLIICNDIINPLFIRPIQEKIHFMNHHLSHAASAYYLSGFQESAVLIIDGCGSEVSPGVRETLSFGYAEGNEIKLSPPITGKIGYRSRCLDKDFTVNSELNVSIENSLGDFYRWFTEFCGFSLLDTGKLMGLAPYGKPTYVNELRGLVSFTPPAELSIRINETQIDDFILELTRSKEGDELFRIRADLAYAAQTILEEVTIEFLNHLHTKIRCDQLVFAGGVALNSVMNAKIIERTPFKKLFVQPAAGDSGTAIGAALYGYHHILGHPYKGQTMKHAYLGKSYIESDMMQTLERYSDSVTWQQADEMALIDEAARGISEGKIIGWFQGGSEMGPRSLGHRSILADARNPRMKDIVNRNVKFREGFRPFAPSVLKEHAHEYFHMLTDESPFMLLVFDVLEEKQAIIPAVTHVDKTARVQTVTEADNGIYYRLIQRFHELTGVPVIMNTSFNVKGEPIVETPEDALKCFLGTQLDFLVLENYIVRKVSSPQLAEAR